MRISILLFVLLCCTSASNWAQEINATVKINTPSLQQADPQIFQTLEGTIQEFMNNQAWTDDVYQNHERINVSIQLTLTEEKSATTFKARLLIQATRPVYGSSYESQLISHVDEDVTFSYEQYQPLEFSELNYTSNLASILSFYAYIIIGMDYDSYSPYAGEPYFQKAQSIMNIIPQAVSDGDDGWKARGQKNRNRFWIIENILTPRLRPFRQAIYDYHRQGLDIMYENAEGGRAIIQDCLKKIQEVNRSYPNTILIRMFANAKKDEIVEVYKPAPVAQQNTVISAMTNIDPARASDYRGIK